MLNPIMYGGVQRRYTPPEEAFDRMFDSYIHNLSPMGIERNRDRYPAVAVEDVKRMFVAYVFHFESFYRSVSEALNDHMAICTSPPPIFMQMRTQDLRSQFSQGYVVNAYRRSGKTTALFDEADEVSRSCATCHKEIFAQWKASPHAANGVECTVCHGETTAPDFAGIPGLSTCDTCHTDQVAQLKSDPFMKGKTCVNCHQPHVFAEHKKAVAETK